MRLNQMIVGVYCAIPCCPEITPPFGRRYFFQNRWTEHNFFMERCQMFLLRCSKWIQHHSGRFRTLPAEFQNFFPSEKNAFSVVYFWSKSPYYRQFAWIFIKIQYFVFPPFASIMASIIFGIRSIGFWVFPIGLVFQTWLSAFFHMCMVRLWPAFFSRLSTSSCASSNPPANSVSTGMQSWLRGG